MKNKNDDLFYSFIFFLFGMILFSVLIFGSCIPDSQIINIRLIDDVYVLTSPDLITGNELPKASINRSAITHTEIAEIGNDRFTIYFFSGLAFRVTTNPQKHQQDFEMKPERFLNLIKWCFENNIPVLYDTGGLANPKDLIKRLEDNPAFR